jgi:hypothetical protein
MYLECQRHSAKLREDEERALHRMHQESNGVPICNKESVQLVFNTIKEGDSIGNPLASMMSSNLRVFDKISIKQR